MIQTSERVRAKAISTKGYGDKERKSLMLKNQMDSRIRRDIGRAQVLRMDKVDKSDKMQYRRKRQSVPQLVIDLQDDKTGQTPFVNMLSGYITKLTSSGKKDKQTISQKLMFPYNNNALNLEASSKKTSSSYKNMNLKTKNCQYLRDEIEQIKQQNNQLREQNKYLKRRLQRVERIEQIFQFTTKQNVDLKKQKQQIEQQHRDLEQKVNRMRQEYQTLAAKLKGMYQQLIREKRKNRQIREFVMRPQKQQCFDEQLFSRQSIYKNSFEKYENDGKADYYTSVREGDRSRSRPNKKDFNYSHIFN